MWVSALKTCKKAAQPTIKATMAMVPKLTQAPLAKLIPAPTLQEGGQRRRKARMGNKTKHINKKHMGVAMERITEGKMRQAMTETKSLTRQMVPPRMDHLDLKDRYTRKTPTITPPPPPPLTTTTKTKTREVSMAVTTNRIKMILSVL